MAVPRTRESFLYCWTDNVKNMLYVGVHKGTETDGYISSSKYFNEEYKVRPENFTRKIIAHGQYNDIKNLETKILKSLNAASDPYLYNKSNSDGKFYCDGHSIDTRKKMSTTWKSKEKWNCDNSKAVAVWQGKTHTPESREKMKNSQAKHSKNRSKKMSSNNPMKNPDAIAKMLETRRINRELRNGSA